MHRSDIPVDYLHVDVLTVARREGRLVRLAVTGELDRDSVSLLEAAFARVCTPPAGEVIEIDARGLTFLDAAGARGLVRCHEAARDAGIRMVLRDPSPWVLRVLTVLGVAAIHQASHA
ncbi:STAS domain-containing protein [Catenuloplanes atrovinosus]|uniref:Anti-anti-sigma factor n=1 Tax=Catenuloplanes atrovinosus TaxID=137266 RepID=A0AAE3YMZ7_9ACTN|nr:STAS domain-containing protein [Catenuloplanes atrovinosus]MDR7276455.1 anti-anti-sigma factor [Catenuloplanes atrovinosus]